ncbi:unnamed protein product [Porites lobata]|uniref:Uncharacterized protein n=1 Tax=Porites lobata TaxID=104759 RepID=A0ABN8ND20_9CNID|nr:unnamed protein product [Porites lobata]
MSSSLAALCRKRNTLNSVPVSLMLGHRMVFNKLIVDVQSVRRVSIKSLSNVISLEPAVFDSNFLTTKFTTYALSWFLQVFLVILIRNIEHQTSDV